MKVTREVIVDLLPLYEAGECSAETRALVEEFLEHDQELAARVRRNDPSLALGAPDLPPPESEARVLLRAQTTLRRRTMLLALAVFLSAFPFSFVIGNRGVEWVMWRQFPAAAIACAVGAVASWIAYFVVGQRVARTGL